MPLTACNECGLAPTARRFVLGVGPKPCCLMIVGEAPGAREDWTGKPFSGPSGALLTALLGSIGLSRDEVYITNLVKYRPPGNRKPHKKEIEACQWHLEAELKVVEPEVVVAMGDTACKWFDKTIQLRKDHGSYRHVPLLGAKVVFMYHPAYALRNPRYREVLIEDFRRLKALLDGNYHPPATVDPQYTYLTDVQMSSTEPVSAPVGFDTETTAPTVKGRFVPVLADVVGWSASGYPGIAFYTDSPIKRQATWLHGPTVKVCHNAKFEYMQLRKLGITLRNFEDTKLMAYLLGRPSTHLKHLVKQELGIEPITYEQIVGKGSMVDLTPQAITPYAAADADHTLRLFTVLGEELTRMGLERVYREIELPLVSVLGEMELRGVMVDEGRARKAVLEFEVAAARELEFACQAGLPRSLNPASHEQLAEWLRDMGAPVTEFTEVKGLPRVDSNSLTALRDRGWEPQILDSLLSFSTLKKLGTFPQSFLDLRTPDGALHPQFNQAGHFEEVGDDARESPATGRLSCSSPNLQQIPHRGRGKGAEYLRHGQLIRGCLVARPGHVFVAADVSQQEPRILAVVANEPTMLGDFEAGVPIYAPMGEAIYGRPITKADLQEWHTAKTFFLALTYGAEWGKLVEIDPRMTVEQAKRGYDRALSRYRGLTAFRDGVRLELAEHGFVRDWFGRIRFLPGYFSTRRADREAAVREGVNMKVQGPAASMIKMGMRRVYEQLPMGAGLVLQIHDEVVVEVKGEEVGEAAGVLSHMCEGWMPISFPLDIKVGESMGELVEWKGGS